ncbi:MAG: hypothetical protein HQ559_04535 [Lentisphaerae bacterium]|nr:hypothetical protein [Lentisphaerota bacterium]
MGVEQQKISHKRLGRELGLLDIVAVATGTMISSGFFLLPDDEDGYGSQGRALFGANGIAGRWIFQ